MKYVFDNLIDINTGKPIIIECDKDIDERLVESSAAAIAAGSMLRKLFGSITAKDIFEDK